MSTDIEEVEEATILGDGTQPDPAITVQENAANPDETTVWHISQNLTDRWGEINHYESAAKPLKALVERPVLLNGLVNQFWDEICFVARKDGAYGILFEVEYCSIESEAPHEDGSLKPHAQVVQALLKGLDKLRTQFPGVPMCVPDKAHMVEERPAVWAFVRDCQLTAEQRESLGRALLSF